MPQTDPTVEPSARVVSDNTPPRHRSNELVGSMKSGTLPPVSQGDREDFAPCPTCRQYSHSIGEDQLVEAFRHFQSLTAQPGHPMDDAFDEKTRDAAQVLMAAARASQAPNDQGEEMSPLKERRKSLGLSLRKVEEITKGRVSNAYLSQLENGKIANPSVGVCCELAAAYGVPFETIAGWFGNTAPTSPKVSIPDVEAVAEARVKAIEECAKVAEDEATEIALRIDKMVTIRSPQRRLMAQQERRNGAYSIARAIRSLSTQAIDIKGG